MATHSKDIANVTKEDTRIVALVWFGSIAFIVSVTGNTCSCILCSQRP